MKSYEIGVYAKPTEKFISFNELIDGFKRDSDWGFENVDYHLLCEFLRWLIPKLNELSVDKMAERVKE